MLTRDGYRDEYGDGYRDQPRVVRAVAAFSLEDDATLVLCENESTGTLSTLRLPPRESASND